jgi:hypothetical protein
MVDNVLREYGCMLPHKKWIVQGIQNLGRRCIGRNEAALGTRSDYVWFTDVDYMFGAGCLDGLSSLKWPSGATMVFPRQIQILKDHATGDSWLRHAVDQVGMLTISEHDFVPHRFNRAVGGVQIVRGDFARKHGYLNVPEWQKPTKRPFCNFKDDIAYREFCRKHGEIVAVDLPGVFRIRHTETAYKEQVHD